MSDGAWPLQWIRACLELAVLGSVIEAPLHGYGIAQHLEGRGFGRLKGGSLYPVLARLENAGHVEAAWQQGDFGPSRKYYTITGAGRRYLTDGLTQWKALARALDPAEEL
ncbi:PadR family transcriptional regulator [Arthrobacter echini]|uniref:PadR family transcriptional regulator n=1 Tax=Arthrobacter echini TaxID=1529066 RepID=UPI001FE46BF9|nr:PadR family transcriptional regulator [Arthrobacter echini]